MLVHHLRPPPTEAPRRCVRSKNSGQTWCGCALRRRSGMRPWQLLGSIRLTTQCSLISGRRRCLLRCQTSKTTIRSPSTCLPPLRVRSRPADGGSGTAVASHYGSLSMHLLARNVASINADASIKCLRWVLTFSRLPSISQVQLQVPQVLVVVIETLWPMYSKCFVRTRRSVIRGQNEKARRSGQDQLVVGGGPNDGTIL